MAKKHLEIIQSTSGTEQVTSDCISKLYALAYEDQEKGIESELDATSDVQGRLSTSKASRNHVKYLSGIEANDPKRFNNLFITVTGGYYIDFEDPKVLAMLLGKGIGDGIGITEAEAALASLSQINNQEIETFDELKYFTAINNLNRLIYNCYSLRKVTFPNKSIALSGDVFYFSGSTISQDIDVNWNGAILTNGSSYVHTIFKSAKGLTWKDSLIPQQTDFTKINIFDACTNINRVIFREGITKIIDTFVGCTLLDYIEYPTTITDMGSAFNFMRGSYRYLGALVIKAVNPPTWTYNPNNNSANGGGFEYARLPQAIYVPDGSVNAYKNVTPLSIGTGTNEEQYAWCAQTIIDKIKPLSELPQGYRDMGTVTQEDINRT